MVSCTNIVAVHLSDLYGYSREESPQLNLHQAGAACVRRDTRVGE
ncbi:hypothetical protein RERY_42970 [Rhodococcus erythropolis]|nr:hypothetical protein [Rhodococcus erythropolis]OFV75131.1 hypothetical protein RERY_42970 [Rhodococcus erythropolis]